MTTTLSRTVAANASSVPRTWRLAGLVLIGAAGLASSPANAQTPYDRAIFPDDIVYTPSTSGPGYDLTITPRVAFRTYDALDLDCIVQVYVNNVQVASSSCALSVPSGPGGDHPPIDYGSCGEVTVGGACEFQRCTVSRWPNSYIIGNCMFYDTDCKCFGAPPGPFGTAVHVPNVTLTPLATIHVTLTALSGALPELYTANDTADVTVNLCGSADFNADGDIGTDADIEAFFACLGGNCCATCGSADFNADGDIGTDADIEAFFRVLGGGVC